MLGAIMARPMAIITRLEPASARSRHSQPGITGSAARPSTHTSAASASAAAASNASEGAEPQAQACPPSSSATISAPSASSTRPRRPSRCGRRGWRRSCRKRPIRPSASTPIGRLTRKIQCQLAYWANAPPSSGPAMAAMPHAGQPALHRAALVHLVQIARQGIDGGHHRARAQALQAAEHDQRVHAPGQRAGRRAGQEDQGAADQHRLAAQQVGQLAVDGDGHGLRQHVDREHPAHQGQAAQVAHDLRDGGGHDVGVHGGQQHHGHQAGQHPVAPGRGGGRCRGGGHGAAAASAPC
jgi:hypothetical protein